MTYDVDDVFQSNTDDQLILAPLGIYRLSWLRFNYVDIFITRYCRNIYAHRSMQSYQVNTAVRNPSASGREAEASGTTHISRKWSMRWHQRVLSGIDEAERASLSRTTDGVEQCDVWGVQCAQWCPFGLLGGREGPVVRVSGHLKVHKTSGHLMKVRSRFQYKKTTLISIKKI